MNATVARLTARSLLGRRRAYLLMALPGVLIVLCVLVRLLAGEDTTSSTAAWALHYLAENPDVHEKVRAEADEVLGDQRLPADPATVGRLKYAEAVVNEVLRIRPVAPFLGFQVKHDLTVGDLALTEGQTVFALTSQGARLVPEPDEFRPARWLDGGLPKDALPFAPFGNGPRFCPGRNLAMIEAALVTSVLGRAFDFVPDRSAGEVQERMAFTVFPTNLFLRVRSRG